MRILYFSRDYTTHDHRFLSALAKTGRRIYYLRLERRGHQLEERALPPEVEILPWSGGNAPARWQDGPRLLFSLKKVIRNTQPDIILAGPLQRSAFLAALSGFRPLVSMSWGYDLLHDAGRNSLWRWATRYTLRRSAAMVGDCDTIRKLAVPYGIPNERVITFPWGIDLAHFTPRQADNLQPKPVEPGIHPDQDNPRAPFTLLSTRNWEPIYGVDLIAQAFIKAAAQRPELRLVMLGNGSQAGTLHRILTAGGLLGIGVETPHPTGSHRVLFPGQIGYQALPEYYRSAVLYVAATHSDGTSISLLEAMACGCPVLVSDIPGNREWVAQGENGWLFPDGDASALAQAILQAVEQRDRLPEMGQKARQVAEARADWGQNFPKLLEALEIAQHGVARPHSDRIQTEGSSEQAL